MQSNKKSTRGVATREVLRSNDTAKRSAEIVVAARELYEEKGLARTSIQDITNHVGVTRSLFYHYFQNKEVTTVNSSSAGTTGAASSAAKGASTVSARLSGSRS